LLMMSLEELFSDDMLQDIDEQVEVSVLFKKNQVLPIALKWSNRIYKIKKFNLSHQIFDGNTRIHYFSVSDDCNFFKLAFNTKSLKWNLEQVYTEG